MLFSKSIFAVAILALSNVVAANTPTNQTPACVLKIIGNQPNPADSKTICGSDASKIQSAISKSCSDSETSLKFFANNCASLGHKVATSDTTTTATATATGTSASSTATGFVTAVSSGSSTQTGSSAGPTDTASSAGAGTSAGSVTESGAASSPTSTFNAASSDRQFSATTFVAAVFLGAAALL